MSIEDDMNKTHKREILIPREKGYSTPGVQAGTVASSEGSSRVPFSYGAGKGKFPDYPRLPNIKGTVPGNTEELDESWDGIPEVAPSNPMVGTMIVEKAAGVHGAANPKQAYGDKKVPLHLVPPVAIAYMGMALKEGAKKYGPYNWRETNVEVMTYIGAALRHIGAYIDGEDTDPESGNPHLAHALASLAILVDAVEGATEIDNRPLPGNGGNLIRREAARATK